jgi:hypothetical protein
MRSWQLPAHASDAGVAQPNFVTFERVRKFSKLLRNRRWCSGKTPLQTFLYAIPIAREKMIAA